MKWINLKFMFLMCVFWMYLFLWTSISVNAIQDRLLQVVEEMFRSWPL